MTVHHPHNIDSDTPLSRYAADSGGSFLSLTGLSNEQKKCLVDLSSRFAQDTRVQPTPPSPPYDYYIRGRKDLQLIRDAIAWYAGELTTQYEKSDIRMVEGILFEAINRLNEIAGQLGICLDVVKEQDGE